MHGLIDNSLTQAHGTAGQTANGGTVGAFATFVSMSEAEYVTFLIIGTQTANTGTFNVFQGTNAAGASAKAVTGASLVTTTTGTAFAIEVKADQLDAVNGFTHLNCMGTVASAGTFWGALASVRTSVRSLPGTNGLNGSVQVVA